MTRLLIIFTILIITSCSSENDKTQVTEYFTEINKLNEILVKNQNRLAWKNNPDSISSKIKGTKEIINLLQEKLNLTEIESHDTVRLQNNIQKSGLAYYFGDRTSQKDNYSILIFAEDNETLELFKYYEQFIDCAKIEKINKNWAFSSVYPDCNN